MDFIRRWSGKTEVRPLAIVGWLGLGRSKYYAWGGRYGKAREHNAWIPRDHWLESWEKEAIVRFYRQYPDEGYRRLAFMMMDRDVVAASPTSVYRVLLKEGLLGRKPIKFSAKGTGFVQPLRAHEQWHVDMSYLNICGTFYYLCSVLDGYSRMIVHWEIREQMKESDVEIVLQRALEKHPGVHPRIISDNGPQFIAKDFKEFIRATGLSHVRTSPYYPQSNGKIERWHRTLKADCIRPGTPLSIDDARRIVDRFVVHYNTVRLHSAISYVTPWDKLSGRDQAVCAARDQKLEQARQHRKINRQHRPDYSLSQQPAFSI
jgi:transposase InsO family protein